LSRPAEPRVFLAIALLAIWAGVVGVAATRLVHVGNALMAMAALALAAAAVGVALRQLWAQLFALSFLSLTGLAFAAAGVAAAIAAASPPGADGFLYGLVTGVVATILLGVAATLAGAVGIGGSAVAAARAASATARWLAIGAAIVLLCSLSWLLGDRYLARQLWTQDSCLAGVAADCYALSRPLAAPRRPARAARARPVDRERRFDWEAVFDLRFSPAERARFARLGCSAGHAGACANLTAAVAAATWPAGSDDASAAFDVLARTCDAGDATICEGLASILYRQGSGADAARFLMRGCESRIDFCASSAKLAAPHSVDVERALYEHGCDRDNARSCRGLLYQRPPDLPADRAALQRKLCLLGDVNDCTPLIRADMRTICPEICSGMNERRAQSCSQCAKAAREANLTDLAAAWQSQACAANRSYCEATSKARPASPAISKQPR